MKKIITTMTQRGQATIPAEVRRLLGLEPGDKIGFAIEDGVVRLAPASFTLDSAFGSVKPSRKPEDFEELSEAAKEHKAEETVRNLGKA
ncbi:MAG: type II toxin-antitoxin system PrlF family antitoxin [Candidatus Bipolaricaulota bacterium]